jgi:cytochrome c oxidase subunit III
LAEQPAATLGQHAPAAHEPAHHPAHHPAGLAHHFDDLQQQREAAELGMWLFLVTEFMFFGGLFLAYLIYRYWYPAEFIAGSLSMDVWLGTLNTLVLLASSLTMALAVHAAHDSQRKALVWLLLATLVLGSVFLGVKAYEYHHKYAEHLIPFAGLPFKYSGPEREGMSAFYNLYFLMTGLHAFHMVIGIALLAILAVLANRGGLLAERSIIVHNAGLYWHFVDLVWVFLFPFFYLVTGHFFAGGH